MSNLEPVLIAVGPPGARIKLTLRRRIRDGATRVLLLHGASAKSDTFLIPSGLDFKGEPRCLADWLWARGYEPWLLDWRGSGTIVDQENRPDGVLRRDRDAFDLDHAAQVDIPAAFKVLLETEPKPTKPVAAIAHCLGAGALSQAIAARHGIPIHDPNHPAKPGLSHLVLLTLGLFYELPAESLLKNDDRAIDRMLRGTDLVVDPRHSSTSNPWPSDFESTYTNWPDTSLPHARECSRSDDMCNRLSFMYGTPYLEPNLAPEVHYHTTIVDFNAGASKPPAGARIRCGAEEAVLISLSVKNADWRGEQGEGRLNLVNLSGDFQAGEPLFWEGERFAIATTVTRAGGGPRLLEQFGPIPLPMFAQGARNARRGNAAPFNADPDDRSFIDNAARTEFQRVRRITLITGTDNTLWNQRSIDNMHQWLLPGVARAIERFRKIPIEGYGHQDLLWGENASMRVFPDILSGLPPP